jgi:hypothetical protein
MILLFGGGCSEVFVSNLLGCCIWLSNPIPNGWLLIQRLSPVSLLSLTYSSSLSMPLRSDEKGSLITSRKSCLSSSFGLLFSGLVRVR